MLKGKARKEAIKKALSKRSTRIAYCEHDLFAFGMYYFSYAFKCKSAKFHKEWCKAFLGNQHLLIIAFRESAKTFWSMVYFIHCIVYKKRRNMFYMCYEKTTANERLFDVANALQTNPEILADF